MRIRRGMVVCLLLVAVLLPTACGGNRARGPESAVQRLYQALEAQDMNEYLDALDPALRGEPDLLPLLSALNVSGGFGGFSLGVDLGSLTKLSFREMRYQQLDVSSDRAHVQADGKMRVLLLAMEVSFCDVHLVRKVGGQWYVSYDQAEQEAKLKRWQQWFEQNGAAPQLPFGKTLSEMFNFCR